MVKACADIVAELIEAHKKGDAGGINLNGIKGRASRKYKLATQPRLVDIIAAVPEEHKAMLLPSIRAKPIRTASGVRHISIGVGMGVGIGIV